MVESRLTLRLGLALAGLMLALLPARTSSANLDPESDGSFEADATEYVEEEESMSAAAADEPARRRFYASVGVGFDFSQGDFGSKEPTNTLATPASLKLEWEPVALRVSIPFLLINGSDDVLGTTEGPTSNGGQVLGESYRYGIGDVTTSLTYTYYPTRKWVPLVDLRVKVKIPTAAEDLGTRKTDTTLQFELTERFGVLSVFGGMGYRFKGGRYDDILLASTGVSVRIMKTLSAGLAFDWRQASIKGVDDAIELSPSLLIKLNKHARFGPYGVVGLSDGAPDWGIGAMSSWNF